MLLISYFNREVVSRGYCEKGPCKNKALMMHDIALQALLT